MEIYPNYYHKFKCIADKCRHSCCIGWEIDIDDETMDYYNGLDTSMGDKIRENIEGLPPHFILKEGDRCPFLNERGLCDIILACGEDALCDICTLHPRFKNFFDTFDEVGLGLACEEAVRLILNEKEKFSIPAPKDITEDEKEFLELRQEIFDVLQNREKSITERFLKLAEAFDIDCNFSVAEVKEKYLSLERLEEAWTEELLAIDEFDKSIFEENAIAFEQFAVYFIFRHLLYGESRQIVKFALMSCFVIGALWSRYDDEDKRFDLVRMYSAEVEYSEENLEELRGSLYAEG